MSDGLPAGWCWTTLDQLGEVSGGITQHAKRESWPLQMPFLRVANVYANELRLEDLKSIGVTEAELPRTLLERGDLLVVEGNGSIEQLGRVAVWDGSVDPCLHQNHLIKVRLCVPETARWALHWLLSHQGREAIQRVASSTSGLHTLSLSKVSTLPVPLAPLEQQVRIADTLDSYLTRLDDAAATLGRVRMRLQRYRASVLKAAVEGRLVLTEAELARAEGRDYEPARVLLDRAYLEPRPPKRGRVNTPALQDLASLPEGWCWSRIEVVGRVQLGRQRAPANHAGAHMRPYLRVANVFEDRIDLSDVMSMNFSPAEFETYRLKHGDILLNEGQSPHLIGRPAMYRGELPGACFTNSLIRFQAGPAVDPRYALIVFRAQLHQRRYMRLAQITTNIAHLGAGRFSEVEFPLAPLAEQARIADEVERLMTIAQDVESAAISSVRRAGRCRQSVLSWAFQGRLVDQEPDDEPASVLLEGIRAERQTVGTTTRPRGRRKKTEATPA